jgi:hypothetical protein
LKVSHLGTEIVLTAAMKDGHVVPACHESAHDFAADEECSTDDERAHAAHDTESAPSAARPDR